MHLEKYSTKFVCQSKICVAHPRSFLVRNTVPCINHLPNVLICIEEFSDLWKTSHLTNSRCVSNAADDSDK